mmetsp:Transcript_20732/g.21021  ORF Transcript_20732/g.21021 Transcript_20732/m.21021 type:complete len:247 (+) Transcript_20732:1-741(+)
MTSCFLGNLLRRNGVSSINPNNDMIINKHCPLRRNDAETKNSSIIRLIFSLCYHTNTFSIIVLLIISFPVPLESFCPKLAFTQPQNQIHRNAKSLEFWNSINHVSSEARNGIILRRQTSHTAHSLSRDQTRVYGLKRRKIQSFLKAGAKDLFRILHSSIGTASLLVGLHHMVHILILHGFCDSIKKSTIVFTGILHALVGVFGVRRLNFRNEREAARNAMFWPAPIQNSWLASASVTEWGCVLVLS